ncbi:MAG: hypothetical protein GKS00_14685 [Alphaproteobacteria bacterium]|nr:hypothetical protein [Alphaproteobacteria bacterium]
MTNTIDYSALPYPVRGDLAAAHRRGWERLAAAGTWWDGATRIAIAAEARRARTCDFCAKRRDALSPYAVQGEHDTTNSLPIALIEVIHRVATDQSRLTRAFYDTALESGISDGEYVETIGVIATVFAVDGFTRAIGLPDFALPDPQPGNPSRHRPVGAKTDHAWVPRVAPEDVTDADAGLYDGLGGANIHRALSLVPAEVMGFFDIDTAQYLPDAALRDFSTEYRDLTHAQIEFLAARVSAINQCVY